MLNLFTCRTLRTVLENKGMLFINKIPREKEVVMKLDWKVTKSFLAVLLSLALTFSLVSCGGGGGGTTDSGTPTPTPTATTTTISGKVSLSSTVTGKPSMLAKKAATASAKARMMKAGKAVTTPATGTDLQKVLSTAGVNYAVSAAALGGAAIELYDASRPEWLYPIATATAGSDGSYTLSKMSNWTGVSTTGNAAADDGKIYADGDDIPSGKYTLIAYKYDIGYGSLFVAVQAIIKDYAGAVTGNDLVAQDSDSVPSVTSMLGLKKNTDGTYGGTTTLLPGNAAIQIVFNMSMARLSVLDAVTVKDSAGTTVIGKWKISPDLLSATFYPAAALTVGTNYTVTITGGKATKAAKNMFGKALAANVTATFTTKAPDTIKPTAFIISPETSTDVPIITAIRVGANEAMDLNTLTITSTPSLGAKPMVMFIGKDDKRTDQYKYVYEFVPSEPLTLSTTYDITVSSGKDLAGNVMNSVSYSFGTEAASASTGIDTTATTTTQTAQATVKGTFGKWVGGLNDRNITGVTSYMTGDFFWLLDSTQGGKQEDLNRDGRNSLDEFSLMLQNWFKNLDACGTTVTGTIVDPANPTAPGFITVAGDTASFAFTLTSTSTNTTDPNCNRGPEGVMYINLQNINGAWLVTSGSDYPVTTMPAPLGVIALNSPDDGALLPEPTATLPALPEFKWTPTTWTDLAGAAKPFATYAVVLLDNNKQDTGWIGMIDGSTTPNSVDGTISIKYTQKEGLSGTTLVVPTGKAFGFWTAIGDIKPGGSYTWSVLGFKTKTINDFMLGSVTAPVDDLGASSSPVRSFGVGGALKVQTLTVTNTAGTTTYDYVDYMNGYDVVAEGTVKLAVSTPDTSATAVEVFVDGYVWQEFTIPLTSGIGSPSPIKLSQGMNHVKIKDCKTYSATDPNPQNRCTATTLGLEREFQIVTTGGLAPRIAIGSITDDTGATLTLDSFKTIMNKAVKSVNITGSIGAYDTSAPSFTQTISMLNVMVWNEGGGQYNAQCTLTGTSFTCSNVLVYPGWNWIELADGNWYNRNGFGIETTTGTTYVEPIKINSITGATKTADIDKMNSKWDAGSSASVTVSVTLASAGNWMFSTGDLGTAVGPGGPTGPGGQGGPVPAGPSTILVNLTQGWNNVTISTGTTGTMGYSYTARIYTTGGTVYTSPFTLTTIDGMTPPTKGTDGFYSVTVNGCSLSITGTSTTSKNMSIFANLMNNSGGMPVYDFASAMADANGAFTLNIPLYPGTNQIDINDASWNWIGVKAIVATGTICTGPAKFDVTSVTAAGATLTKDTMGTYNAGSASEIVITGTAKAGAMVNINVSAGMNWGTQSVAATTAGIFTATVKIFNGFNNIGLSEGPNFMSINVNTTSSGTVMTQPISLVQVWEGISTTPGTSTGLATAIKTGTGEPGMMWSDWNSAKPQVTVQGTASMVNGTGTYMNTSNGTSGSFTIDATGKFMFTVDLLSGNNWIDIRDANWNMYSLKVWTAASMTGTTAPTKLIAITSPTQGTPQSGVVTVTGKLDMTKFPSTVFVLGEVDDYTSQVFTFYSTNPLDQTTFGDKPITFDPATGNFSFTANVTAGNTTVIWVHATDSMGFYHEHDITVNGTTPGEFYMKPKAKARR